MTSILDRLAHLETRVAAIERRAEAVDFHRIEQILNRTENRIMVLADDVTALKASVAAMLRNPG